MWDHFINPMTTSLKGRSWLQNTIKTTVDVNETWERSIFGYKDWSWVDAGVISEDLELEDFFLFDSPELPLDFCERRVQHGTRYWTVTGRKAVWGLDWDIPKLSVLGFFIFVFGLVWSSVWCWSHQRLWSAGKRQLNQPSTCSWPNSPQAKLEKHHENLEVFFFFFPFSRFIYI